MRRVVVALAFCAAACSLFTDLGGFSNGQTSDVGDAAPADGPVTNPDSATIVPNDAGGTTDGDATTKPFCVPGAHAFCTDFEGLDPFSGLDKFVDAPGKLVIDSQLSHSPTHAMRATNPRQASSVIRYVNARYKTDGWKRVVVDLEYYVVKPSFQDGDVNAGIFGLAFFSDGGSQGFAVSVAQSDTILGVTNNNTYLSGPTSGVLAYDKWVHAHFDATPGGAITAKIGDNTYATSFPTNQAGANPRIEIAFGVLGYNSPAPQFDVLVDDVTVDFP